MSINIVLYQPEIPPNTGNILRLCANTGAHLHLIRPLGFSLNDKTLKRAGLDYISQQQFSLYNDFGAFLEKQQPERILCASTKAKTVYTDVNYNPEDVIMFGPETRGLPTDILQQYSPIRIPMAEAQRSINLANSAAIILYHALFQLGFPNLK